ncbi:MULTISPECIES: CaiB/BaiF CoA transferase family protein [Acinetobacter]|uniref:CaiB/BaiF CoA transferase family protein n=1 Tax=Acinetobacter TaxID=469 RepID=UPI0013625FE6|nr:CaiB/BaiF CoA-transferase family protein [Acinetobacter indicus]MDM1243884.1 CoA transferase [Acinetobacter indicus]MDM1285750.1 CoA transferase [Acinetobacter indicus]MDM1287937.1 CoA transferase [Acinetobacter indicus]
MHRSGPLSHLTVVEFAGLGPAPFAGMLLADQGARVIRIDRPVKLGKKEGMAALTARDSDVLARGRESIALDLKQPEAIEIALKLIEKADILIEGFRPGVMEKLGLGPDICLARNPKLVYGRVTGWGQTGPLAQSAGHDINYIALTGALHSTARADGQPTPTPGFIGDFGGGGMLLAYGVLAAVSHAQQSGEGQVVDAAITEGAALLTALIQGWHSVGLWNAQAGTNNGDGGAHFYDTYRCADGKYISIGPMEPQFYQQFLDKMGLLEDADFQAQWKQQQWPQLKQRLAELFQQQSRAHWCDLFEGTDACFAPVLSLAEAPLHPHNVARGSYSQVNNITQPSPAPKFSKTTVAQCQPVNPVAANTQAILTELDYSPEQINALLVTAAQQL